MKTVYALLFLFVGFSYSLNAQLKTPQPSPFCKIEQRVGLTDVTIEYSRPSLKARKVFGYLVPYNKMWRLGANKNTIISFSDDVKVNGNELKKGSYALFAKPNKDVWTIYFYNDTNNWGTPRDWDASKVAAEFQVDAIDLPVAFETLLINISKLRNGSAEIQIAWEAKLVTMKLEVPTKSTVDANIDRVMTGPSASDYYNAASYYLEEGYNLETAEKYINKALEGKEKFWVVRKKALILGKLGRYEEAIKVAERSIELAKEAGNDDYVRNNEASIRLWKTK